MTAPTPAVAPNVIYAMSAASTPMVKIGITNDVEARRRSLQTGCPYSLVLLWTAEGGTDLESYLHRCFALRRREGEWFDFNGVDAVQEIKQAIKVKGRRVAIPNAGDIAAGNASEAGRKRSLLMRVGRLEFRVRVVPKTSAEMPEPIAPGPLTSQMKGPAEAITDADLLRVVLTEVLASVATGRKGTHLVTMARRLPAGWDVTLLRHRLTSTGIPVQKMNIRGMGSTWGVHIDALTGALTEPPAQYLARIEAGGSDRDGSGGTSPGPTQGATVETRRVI